MFKEAEKAILKHFQTLWVNTSVDYDNIKFTPVYGVPWVRLQVEWSDVSRVSISSKSKKGIGFVLVSIFVPGDSGTLKAWGYAGEVATLFDDWEDGPLRFKVSTAKRVGQGKGWYQVNVTCPFDYSECTKS